MAYTPEEKKAATRTSKLKYRPLTPITPYTPEERRAARKLASRKWFEKNRKRVAATSKAWKKTNPQKMREQYLRRYPKQMEVNQKYRLKGYGLTVEDYNRMFDEQGGLCAICYQPSDIRLAVDHCHNTNRVRGLLCGPCNRGIGMLKDNADVLISAARYLHEAAAAHLDELLG